MQNQAGQKSICKKTRKISAGQSSIGGTGVAGETGVFSVSLVEVWKSHYVTQHLPIHRPSQLDSYGGGGLMPMDGAWLRRQLRAVPNSGNVPV
jgi:hypothetical protein